MRKDKPTTTINNLPREIVIDVLSRLPTSSLFTIKLVCHSWRNLAQDPLLIHLHFTRIPEYNPCLVLHNDHPFKNQLHVLHLYPYNNHHGIVKKISVPTMPEFDVVGFCNGWLCLCDSLSKSSLHMYNPFSSSFMELPNAAHNSDVWTAFGFGFNRLTKEYKVLMFSSIARNSRLRGNYRYYSRSQVNILTVGNPEWRSLGQIPYYPIKEPSRVVVNGRLHWVDWPRRYHLGRRLISFDLAEETFQEVPRPESAAIEWRRYMLAAIRGCLAAAVYGCYGSFQIWIMKEYGVKESWNKEFSIGSYLPRQLEQDNDHVFKVSKFYKTRFTRILCGLRNGEILLEYKHGGLVVYDPISGSFNDIMIPEMPNWFEATCNIH